MGPGVSVGNVGEFRGIIEHLPYLRDLGVTAIRLTPTYINANEFASLPCS